jgi:outer membrane protein, multidrug efflux system
MRKGHALSLLILTVTFNALGCMIGPNYKRPAVDTPQSWRFEEKEAKDLANTTWWEQFEDPVLSELIQTGLRENKDLMIAAARIEQFLGYYRTTRGNLFPEVSAGATAGMEQISRLGIPPLPKGTDFRDDFYQAFLSGSWEIDFWGKLRRATEAARADLLSTEEARRTVILTLVTSVASAYVNLRDLDNQLEIAKRTAKSREESYRIFTLRFKGGVVSELELYQIKSQYEEALSTIPVLEKAIAQQENALSVLLGRNPDAIARGKSIDELSLPAVPQGLPSDLLARRPDILQAEQDLIAANARIGEARALYFPTISITGSLGTASTQLSDLFTGPAGLWSFAAPIAAPIFTAGRISGQVKTAKAVQTETLFRYLRTIQNAFREVNDALVDQMKTREQLAVQANQVDSLRKYAHCARVRYDEGYTSYIEVLDAERSLFNSELSYTQTKGGLFQALVNTYKAMGGGWITEADKMTSVQKETGGKP